VTVLRSGSASHVGRVRTVNEDVAFEGLTLFAVADGMGGHVGGEIAAQVAIDTLKGEFSRTTSVDGLAGAVHEANRAVWERGRAEPDLRGMGTTLTAAALVATDEGDRLVIANVGDSRAYRLHGDELIQVSTDHSVAEELVARGELSEEEAAIHPHRHILTRVLGVGPSVDVDIWEVVPEEGDRFLLCSDGLTNEVSSDRIANLLTGSRDPQEAADSLVAMANKAGGSDNITVVVLDVVVGEQPSKAAATPADGADRRAEADAVGAAGTAGPAAEARGASSATTMVASPPLAAPPAPETGLPGAVREAGRPATAVALLRDTEAPSRPEPAPKRSQPPRPRIHVPRRITFRVLLFLILLGGVVYAGYAAVHWYVYDSYYVGLDHQQVVIYQGRIGGFAGIKPRIYKRYAQVTTADVPTIKLADLRAGVEEPSLQAAKDYVSSLESSQCALQNAPAFCQTTTTTAPSTATTVP
jgi:serine/threonine protein phosphatase PrpC